MTGAALVVLAWFGGLAWAAPAGTDRRIAVVVSRQWSDLDSIALPLLRNLYLGRRSRLLGERVERFDLPSGSDVRRAFSAAVLGKSERSLEEYWIQQALTGGSLPPRELVSANDVVAAVARRRGAIGYVDYETLLDMNAPDVRVLPIAVAGELLFPSNAGYPIR